MEAFRYTRGDFEIIDQTLLPRTVKYIKITTVEEAWDAIRTMKVRGAPAIAIEAALGISTQYWNNREEVEKRGKEEVLEELNKKLDYLRTSRPTAVNLFNAIDLLQSLLLKKAREEESKTIDLITLLVEESEKLFADDLKNNKIMGKYGADRLFQFHKEGEKISVLTHCNTGSLATAGYGTALGVIRSLHESGRLERAYCTETRPYNQGSRLTAFELLQDKIPSTLITDSMAGALLSKGKIQAIIAGADRITANGDTANKIGTYSLAVLAKHHNVPFYIAAPIETLDVNLSDGSLIEIEERSAKEVTEIQGIPIAPEGVVVWNPSFDVTPFPLIEAIVTNLGVIEKPSSDLPFDVPSFLQSHSS